MLVVKAWRYYYTCTVDIIAVLLYRICVRMNPFVCFSERQDELPPFQGYRTQSGPPRRTENNMEQPYYSEQGVNGPAAPMNSYHGGMGVHQEEPLFNPRGPGRGGETRDPNEQIVKNTLCLFLSSPLIFLGCSVCTVFKNP